MEGDSVLRDDAEWQHVYSDPVSAVFLRRTERHADVLSRFRKGALRYDRSPVATTFPAG